MSAIRVLPVIVAFAPMVACSGGAFPAGAELSAPTCDGRALWDPADNLELAVDADYVGLALPEPWDASGEEYAYPSERGERCAEAADGEGCEAQLEDWLGGDYRDALITRRGGAIDFTSGRDIVAELLPIDTLDEAMLVARTHGYLAPWCDTDSSDGGREVEGGYELVLRGDIECFKTGRGGERREVVYRHLLQVDANGTLTELDREVDSKGYCEDLCRCRSVDG